MIKRVILIVSFVFAVVGCGGGGDVDNTLPSAPSESQKADINENNSKKIALSSYSATGIIDDVDYGNFDEVLYTKKIATSKKLLARVSIEAKKISGDISYDIKESCENGGYYMATQKSDSEAEVEYNNCNIYGTTYNGYAYVKKINDTYVTITFKNFTIDNSLETLKITNALFKIDWDTSIVKVEDFYAKDIKDGKTTEYLNFNTSLYSDDSGANKTLKFDGWVKSDCSEGYVYIRSANELNFNEDNISGAMEVSSKGETITISFDDSIVRIYDNSGNLVDTINTYDLPYEAYEECN